MTLPSSKRRSKYGTNTQSPRSGPSRGSEEAHNQAALAAESATRPVRLWQQIGVDNNLRAVYRAAAPSYVMGTSPLLVSGAGKAIGMLSAIRGP